MKTHHEFNTALFATLAQQMGGLFDHLSSISMQTPNSAETIFLIVYCCPHFLSGSSAWPPSPTPLLRPGKKTRTRLTSGSPWWTTQDTDQVWPQAQFLPT